MIINELLKHIKLNEYVYMFRKYRARNRDKENAKKMMTKEKHI